MGTLRRGVQELRTALGLARRRGPRTEAGIFRELAVLKHERGRLNEEKRAWERKVRLIEARLQEVAAKEAALEREAAEITTAAVRREPVRAAEPRPRNPTPEEFPEIVVRY